MDCVVYIVFGSKYIIIMNISLLGFPESKNEHCVLFLFKEPILEKWMKWCKIGDKTQQILVTKTFKIDGLV